ncbi:hypothetical protein BBO99_00008088 [Phytophthora kernoviae]|uniref:START domain-containing protein n=2 Tax=Phytophthora kernoviae TaxID=325452 RepID=A0A3R7HEF3_9STRA|nr:hypothetical protein G195_010579 [Phytophthora kernoviae 00238/432]KAG2508553.1 hypothetical protein JM18_009205 [Phytophthora kernoviae]KAG2509841.1 hypothetical protein JM16_007881 [Phytophthora kernoviae]RLN25823.1 hypothetical protein BBI17_008137 [Phytophthora kernoviae]RLN75755.1 hypothetical protein BBO99_00008088 [Phytophthora kernoviae]
MDSNSPLGGIPRLQFSEERRRQFEAMSDDMLEHTLNVHNEFHASKKQFKANKQWKLVRRKKSLNIYRERGKSSSKKERTLLCSGVVPGTIEDMINGTYADNTDSMRISLSILTDTFMDGSVLHVFEKNPVASSVIFSGIKWMALKMPSTASLIHDRDVLAYHRIGRIVDNRRGQYFVYYVAQSIDLPELPANQQRHLERAEVSLCYLFRQVQEDWVNFFELHTPRRT